MGLFNKFKKDTNIKNKENNYDVNEVESTIKEIDNLPGTLRSREVAHEQANKILQEMKIEEFNERYKDISSLIDSVHLCTWNNSNKNLYMKYERLNSNSQKQLFLPYYIEKQELGIASSKDLQELKELTEGLQGDIKKQYTSGVVLLGFYNLIDIKDNETFSKSFSKYSIATRDNINNTIHYLQSETKQKQNKESNVK
ncbi:MAG: hypothetical protein IJ097_03125 [Bacilli bacterium]|nr:hypothetical protein [Bacilli bacterium]